jgi:PadR family transcriptional regulator, regulatory protein PadR
MGKGFLTYSTAVILQAVANGYRYGFDIIDITGVPGGTVYPALRRLEELGYLTSKWEKPSIAQSEPRPPRKYYEMTRAGREALAEALKRYRLLEQTQQLKKETDPKPSGA